MYNISGASESNIIKANVKIDNVISKIDKDKKIVFLLNLEEKKKRIETNKRNNRKIKALII